MDEYIDAFGDAKILYAFVVNSGYWQTKVHKNDRYKTGFTSHHGFYQFRKSRFWWQNASATSQLIMDVVLSTRTCQYSIVNVVYIVLLSRTPEEHFSHTGMVLRLLKMTCVTLKLNKPLSLQMWLIIGDIPFGLVDSESLTIVQT